MRVTCFCCGLTHEITASDQKALTCPCGSEIDLEEVRSFEKIMDDVRDQQGLEEVQRMADDICFKIVSGEYSRVDLEIAQEKLRERCAEYFPEKMQLFEMIYGSRFKRLWEQFRTPSDGSA